MVELVHYIDVSEQKRLITQYSPESVTELFEFGTLVSNEVQNRSAQLDSKLCTYLGYGTALVALLGIGGALPVNESVLARSLVVLSVIAAIFAVGFAAWGLMWQEWPVPSEWDWFNSHVVENHDRLRRFHVIALLKSHQIQLQLNVAKTHKMRMAEIFLVTAAVLAASVLLLRIL